MEKIINKMLEGIKHGKYHISESGCLITDGGWIYEDTAHDYIVKTRPTDKAHKLPTDCDLAKAFRNIMGGVK